MPRALTSPDRLFDRTWRPGHPFRPRLSRTRRLAMLVVLVLLSTIIGGYWYITDSNRVRAMAQDYLSRLIGGRVTIGSATLSIFQGLRLYDVRVYVNDMPDRAHPDAALRSDRESLLFRAHSFLVRADPKALMDGRLEATQIVAIEPYVRLAEDQYTGRWNHQGLRRGPTTLPVSKPGAPPPLLPEVILRNAVIENCLYDNGQYKTRGNMAIEGKLTPGLEPDVYHFTLQSRGATQGIGPSVEGKIDMIGGSVTASLMNFRFGPDLETMLPTQVRKWWHEHEISGRVDVPELTYQSARGAMSGMGNVNADAPPSQNFRAEIDVRGVRLVVHPSEWLSGDEMRRETWAHNALLAMRGAGLDTGGFISELEETVQPTPITLHQVTGKFVFTEEEMSIENISGFVESNGLKISGRVRNYASPADATASIRVSSLDTDDILIPASPRYINSMPQTVREIYDHLRPQGHCRFWVQLDRPSPDERALINGEIEVIDGQFVFDRFPYPVSGATGRLVIGKHPRTGAEMLEIKQIRGHGPPGGPNGSAEVSISGIVSPFGAETGVNITVVGEDVVSEPMLFGAFPLATQKALRMFDAAGKGEFPRFRGGFRCDVERPVGLDQHWNVVTTIRLDEAAGALVAFPYPMSGVSGLLTVTDDRVKIEHAMMKRDGATLQIDGEVTWGDPAARSREQQREAALAAMSPAQRMQSFVAATQPASDEHPSLRPDLHVVATNVPIDDQLLSALPADQRAWLRKTGLTGRFDIDGRVMPATQPAIASVAENVAPSDLSPAATPAVATSADAAAADSSDASASPAASPSISSPDRANRSDIGFDFKIALHDASAWPVAGTFAATNIGGQMRLTPGRMIIDSLRGKRGDADLSAHGSVDWSAGSPLLELHADAKNLAMDSSLYQIIPPAGRSAWDQVRPEGTLDATLAYANGGAFQLVLTPRQLSAMPTAVPYKLDRLSGTVNVLPDKVVLSDMAGRHGDANVRFSATGDTSSAGATKWDFRLSGDNVLVDDDFKRAVPKALAEVINSLQLRGKLAFAFDKLAVNVPKEPAPSSAIPASPTSGTPTSAVPTTAVPIAALPTAALPTTAAPTAAAPTVAPSPGAPTLPSATAPIATSPIASTKPSDTPVDVDFAMRLQFDRAALDVGVPLADVQGMAQFSGISRQGKLEQLAGSVDIGTLTLAGRPARDLRAQIAKPAGQDVLRIARLETKVAGGDLAGQFDTAIGESGPSRYAANIVLREADIAQLTGDSTPDLRGRLSASLAIEGSYNNIATRRGRGDVTVSGEKMYRIPLLLGLLQVTNLALPITSPFSEGMARYSVDGNRVTFETIELRAKDMLMQGNGHLDFGNKQVRLTFVTDSTTWPKVPIIGDLIQGARHELLQIHVKGTLEEPKVSAGTMGTFTTTVDEVLRGNDNDTPPKRR